MITIGRFGGDPRKRTKQRFPPHCRFTYVSVYIYILPGRGVIYHFEIGSFRRGAGKERVRE